MKVRFILAPIFAFSVLAAHNPAGVSSEPVPKKAPPISPSPEPVAEKKEIAAIAKPYELTATEIRAVGNSGMAPSDLDCYVLTQMKHPDDKDYIQEVNFYFAQKLDDTDTKQTDVNDILKIMDKRREEFLDNPLKAKKMAQDCHSQYQLSMTN